MATVSAALRHVKQHLQCLVPESLIFQLCRQSGHVWRRRLLDPATTVHLFLLQLLAGVALTGLRHVAALPVTAQALCAARMRLPLTLLMELVRRGVPRDAAVSTWHGLKLYLVDGVSFTTQDTPELLRRYGKAKNHKGVGHGHPNPKLLALMDLAGGFIHQVIALPWHRQEFTCLARLFKAIGPDGLLLGDRGLVSFAHLALLRRQGIDGCFRLPRRLVVGRGDNRPKAKANKAKANKAKANKAKANKRSRRLLERLGRQDLIVTWRASVRPAWISRRRWATLADTELRLRQIAFRLTRPGSRTRWAWIITTLLDPEQHPAQDLIDLYGKRWQIEVYFRDLKRTLGMSLISARTVQGVRKEILAFVLLYNLVRGVMAEAAERQRVAAGRISFVDALRWLLWASPGDPLPPLLTNPTRVRLWPARRVKAGRHRFAQLNESRADSSKPTCTAKL